ncbi:MAG: LysR family transcriptional regulator [Candidatus Methylacidiphilales bacterium]|nr:LysR family transcriptional regulator [Candidatus Methylacidiphilales bacterium]
MMNPHHLELFYYVAKHRGIVAACRHIPYGVQQPAVSSQLIKLEESVGARLFERKPFQLTTAGAELFAFISPFFAGLADVESSLKGRVLRQLRLAGPTQLMRDHLPELLTRLQREEPGAKLRLIEADQRTAQDLLLRGEVDLAVAVMETRPPAGLKVDKLIDLPLLILVQSRSPYKRSVDVIRDGAAGKVPLVALPDHELLSRLFQTTLREKGLRWPVSIEVNSTELAGRYVALGIGAGLSAASPAAPPVPGVRALALQGFPTLPVAALWKGSLTPLASRFLSALRARAAAQKLPKQKQAPA